MTHYIDMYYFTQTKTVDFEAKNDYTKNQLAILHTAIDFKFGQQKFSMTINEVEMQDSIINPFASLTDSIKFLTLEASPLQVWDIPYISIEFKINVNKNKFSRTRYSFW